MSGSWNSSESKWERGFLLTVTTENPSLNAHGRASNHASNIIIKCVSDMTRSTPRTLMDSCPHTEGLFSHKCLGLQSINWAKKTHCYNCEKTAKQRLHFTRLLKQGQTQTSVLPQGTAEDSSKATSAAETQHGAAIRPWVRGKRCRGWSRAGIFSCDLASVENV